MAMLPPCGAARAIHGMYGTPEAGTRTAYVPWRTSFSVPQVRTLRRRPARSPYVQYGDPGACVSTVLRGGFSEGCGHADQQKQQRHGRHDSRGGIFECAPQPQAVHLWHIFVLVLVVSSTQPMPTVARPRRRHSRRRGGQSHRGDSRPLQHRAYTLVSTSVATALISFHCRHPVHGPTLV